MAEGFSYDATADTFHLLNLPTPPSANRMYASTIIRTVGGKMVEKRFLSGEGKQYKAAVASMMDSSGATTRLREFLEFHLSVDMMMFSYAPNWWTQLGTPHKKDCDNQIKILKDTLFEGTGVDDSHAFFVGIRKLHHTADKFVNVTFTKTPDKVDEL